MNPRNILMIAVLATATVQGQEEPIPSFTAGTGIPGPIADGTVPPPVQRREPIPSTILSSTIKRIQVTESPEMADLPAVQGAINVTVQVVADPGLPDPPEPLPPLPLDDPAVQARLEEARDRYRETQILFVSARVLDFEKTILEVYPNGQANQRVSVVSSIDYNDFSGFATFNVAGVNRETGAEEVRQYALIMAIGNEITSNMKRIAAKGGRTYQAPQLPEVPEDGAPAYVVTEGDNGNALEAINDMHSLYRVEGLRMNASRIAREKAHAERRAYLLANPPKPRDVTIQFWERNAGSQPLKESR